MRKQEREYIDPTTGAIVHETTTTYTTTYTQSPNQFNQRNQEFVHNLNRNDMVAELEKQFNDFTADASRFQHRYRNSNNMGFGSRTDGTHYPSSKNRFRTENGQNVRNGKYFVKQFSYATTNDTNAYTDSDRQSSNGQKGPMAWKKHDHSFKTMDQLMNHLDSEFDSEFSRVQNESQNRVQKHYSQDLNDFLHDSMAQGDIFFTENSENPEKEDNFDGSEFVRKDKFNPYLSEFYQDQQIKTKTNNGGHEEDTNFGKNPYLQETPPNTNSTKKPQQNTAMFATQKNHPTQESPGFDENPKNEHFISARNKIKKVFQKTLFTPIKSLIIIDMDDEEEEKITQSQVENLASCIISKVINKKQANEDDEATDMIPANADLDHAQDVQPEELRTIVAEEFGEDVLEKIAEVEQSQLSSKSSQEGEQSGIETGEPLQELEEAQGGRVNPFKALFANLKRKHPHGKTPTAQQAKENIFNSIAQTPDHPNGTTNTLFSNLFGIMAKHLQTKAKNWQIKSFIPKPAANVQELSQSSTLNECIPDQQFQDGKSISFIASSAIYNDLKHRFNSKHRVFVDQDFKPDFSSILGFGEGIRYSMNRLRAYEWKRPTAIFPGQEYHIFEGDINPKDILQGEIGDCYFLCSVAAIAERQDRIKKLFLTREVQECGCYCVALCLNGVWEEVIVDDHFPCKDYGNGRYLSVFNTTTTNELWVMLLEKAWAKVHGGYMNISAGMSREALRDLTGAPTMLFNTRKPGNSGTLDDHWVNIIEAEDKHFILTAATADLRSDGSDGTDPVTGLSGNHGYSLLSAYEIYQDESGKFQVIDRKARKRIQKHPEKYTHLKNKDIIRLVELRNPWGKGEWTGEFSDESWIWKQHPELNEILHHHSLDEDGIFFMRFEDFLQYFENYTICYYYDKYLYSSQRYEKSIPRRLIGLNGVMGKGPFDTVSFVKFKITKAGNYYIGLNQVSKRNFSKANGKF